GFDLPDGPFPEHYEPLESPLQQNPLSAKHRFNPTIPVEKILAVAKNRDLFFSSDRRFPYIASTFRVTEHWQTGVMTRHTPWLLEMQPQMFVEISRELAEEKGIKGGEKVTVSSARGSIWAIAIVTDRFKPFKVMGTTIHQVGLPWHFGWQYPADGSGGDSANILVPFAGDPNTLIPESKAFLVNIEKVGG
ncbi:MAG TPA: molybdopterin dinucleotide binding domain-containing protein, partial [Candidatus Acidoferrum sp.]|nr:molybdopterin dinucleotide binding domain-containing protein [Candidatus Acidoferrum sp.]